MARHRVDTFRARIAPPPGVLEQLQAVYLDARCAQITAAPLTVKPGTCRYGCGRPWQLAVTSRLDGHARCMVTPAFCDELRRVMLEHPAIGFTQVAQALGVNYRVVRLWWQQRCQPSSVRACP